MIAAPEHLRKHLASLSWKTRSQADGVDAIENIGGASLPCGMVYGAVHEVLTGPTQGSAGAFVLAVTQAAARSGAVVWSDPRQVFYAPAVAAWGLDLGRFVLLRPKNRADELWALTQALRCRGVSVVIASPPKLTRVEARRLQLAAETGGGIALLLRSPDAATGAYAAATRWRVRPMPGDEDVRRLRVQLVHGHGGRVGETLILETCRETNIVRATQDLADRSSQTPADRVTA